MLSIFQAQRLGIKKIFFGKGKSLFVIIPISLMFAIIVIASSEAINLIGVAHNSIFSPIQSQNEVLEINKSASLRPRDIFSGTADTGYTTTDTSLISAVSNVEKASLLTDLPLENVTTSDLFDGKSVTLTSLDGLDAEYASLYTNNSFTYTEGQPIPIILNANDFVEIYQDWQGKEEISIDFSAVADPSQADTLSSQSPLKTKAISYDRNSLIGKEFTLTVGGLDPIQTIVQTSTSTGIKYSKKTAETIASEEEARKTAISTYWDLDKISTPLTYKFVVVGISEGTDKTKAFIPSAFAAKLLQDYIGNELQARNTTTMPTSEQNSTYLGLVYDGVSLKSDSTSTLFAGIRNQVNRQVEGQISDVNAQIDIQNKQIQNANQQNNNTVNQFIAENSGTVVFGPGGAGGSSRGEFKVPTFQSIGNVSKLDASNIQISFPGQAVTYTIPGLVFTKDRTTNEITGETTTLDLTKSLPLESTSILVKLNDVANRDQVVKDLNSKGYNYQDYSQYKQYDKLESYLSTMLNVASIAFMVVTALFILINMAKFVSEGRKEIGIFRAIGATKGDIRSMFILQALSYILLSLLIGAVIGGLAVYALSNVMVSSAQSFINSAVGSSVVLNGAIVQSDFLRFNFEMIGLYAVALLVVSLIVSLIPSCQAANVSPVEAIRNS